MLDLLSVLGFLAILKLTHSDLLMCLGNDNTFRNHLEVLVGTRGCRFCWAD